jgi:hypothetical protein
MASDRLLWTLVLLPPVVWAVHLCLTYFLASVACDGAWPLTLHLASVVSLAAIAGGGVVSWRTVSKDVSENDPPPKGRAHFMAAAGVGFALIFGATVLAQWYPMFLIEPCRV